MNYINIKLLSEDALNYLKENLERVTKLIQDNDDNKWIYNEFPQPMFVEKKFQINDFDLKDNPDSKNKNIDLKNSILLYESLSKLPRYIITDQNFWLWLHFEKFYIIVKNMMTVNNKSTIYNHWMHGQGVRRGLMFGVLSRCYFRVSLSIDKENNDPYHLTKWVVDNPLRFRELTWRTYSSEEHIVRGILKGEKRAIEEIGIEENVYAELAKSISLIGSVRLLDAISEKDIEQMTYEKMLKLLAKY